MSLGISGLQYVKRFRTTSGKKIITYIYSTVPDANADSVRYIPREKNLQDAYNEEEYVDCVLT